MSAGTLFQLSLKAMYRLERLSITLKIFLAMDVNISLILNVYGYIISAVPKGYVQVGKIVYNPKDVLGHGCEGTFVYR